MRLKPELSLKNVDWDSRRWTVIITHGFMGSAFNPWVRDMEEALLKIVSSTNVFVKNTNKQQKFELKLKMGEKIMLKHYKEVETKTNFLRLPFLQRDFNIVSCDWQNGSSGVNYIRAAVNTRVVGAEVAR